jgi:hypothetical protein
MSFLCEDFSVSSEYWNVVRGSRLVFPLPASPVFAVNGGHDVGPDAVQVAGGGTVEEDVRVMVVLDRSVEFIHTRFWKTFLVIFFYHLETERRNINLNFYHLVGLMLGQNIHVVIH